jgi:hypothetical protein
MVTMVAEDGPAAKQDSFELTSLVHGHADNP